MCGEVGSPARGPGDDGVVAVTCTANGGGSLWSHAERRDRAIEKCLAAGCFQTDHVFGCVTDDVENFFLMPKTLNTKFSFHSEQQFKEEYTGGAWESVVVFVKHALIMYRSSGRL